MGHKSGQSKHRQDVGNFRKSRTLDKTTKVVAGTAPPFETKLFFNLKLR
jgi:hypothetical protein